VIRVGCRLHWVLGLGVKNVLKVRMRPKSWFTRRWRKKLQVAEGRNHQTQYSTGKHILPVVPVVIHPRDGDHGRQQQRQEDDAELGHMAAPVERLDLAGQVPRQEA